MSVTQFSQSSGQDVSLCMIYTYHDDAILTDDVKNTPLFQPLPVPKNLFFESYMFQESYEHLKTTHIGHTAYSYMRKIPAFDFLELVKRHHDKDAIALLPSNHNMYTFAETYHPGFVQIWERLIMLLGYNDYKSYGVPVPFYCNYWIMKRELFLKYQAVAKKAMDLLTTDTTLVELANKDSSYKGTHECLPSHRLLEICGKPYYTFHPFILERLVCFFVVAEGAKVQYVTKEDVNTVPMNTYISAQPQVYLTRTKNNKTVLL